MHQEKLAGILFLLGIVALGVGATWISTDTTDMVHRQLPFQPLSHLSKEDSPITYYILVVGAFSVGFGLIGVACYLSIFG